MHKNAGYRVTLAAATAAAITGSLAAGAGPAAAAVSPGAISTTASSAGARSSFIVVLRNQHPDLSAKAASRRRVTGQDQAPLVSRARAGGATAVKTFSVVNGFAATMTAAQARDLAADPSVAEVVPDRMVPLSPLTPQETGTIRRQSGVTAPPDHQIPGSCPANPAKPLLEPEALQTTHTAFLDRSVPQAQNLVDGAGVKVAWIADGIDIKNPDFIRADGTPVFTDYQDFSGTDPALGTGGGEAFGDASSIAAQGRQVYDLSKFVDSAHPLPAGCTITVRGVAPGASMVGLNVFGASNFAINSSIIQAVDYAVTVDKVDVINESFGSNAFPTAGTDPTALADDAAVAAGVTVVSSTGDAGPTNTVGSPAVDPNVISVGATTTFRVQAQTGYAGTRNFAASVVSDNPSPLSSGGVTDLGRVADLVAPGQDGWALCTPDPARFTECTAFNGTPSPIEDFGGTSESSPLVAGAAALVIEAYEHTHHGVRPAPALVKRILTGTATDLGLPSTQQGAGELNTYRAVLEAMSIHDATAAPARQGDGLAITTPSGDTQLAIAAPANRTVDLPVVVTNTGSVTQTVRPHGRILGRTLSDLKASIPLDIASAATPSFLDGIAGPTGVPVTRRFAETAFTVPAGADHLEAQLSWPGGAANGQSLVRLALIGPHGEYENHSIPQGAGNHGRADVRFPVPGRWTAVFFASASSAGFNGNVNYAFSTTRYVDFAQVSPAGATLRPGQSATFHVRTRMPDDAGDLSAAVEFDSSRHFATAVPLTLRTLLSTSTDGGAFTGTLTGGNGRGNPGAQTQAYFFDVPQGKRSLGIDLRLAGPPNHIVNAALQGPDGQVLSLATNQTVDAGGNVVPISTLQGFVRSPAAGRWTLFIDIDNPVAGTTLTERFSGHLRFNLVDVDASGLPHGSVPAGKPITLKLRVTNTGAAPEAFFADPRRTTQATYPLLVLPPSTATISIPFPATAFGTTWLVPTETSDLKFTQSSTIPADFDVSTLNNGIPELLGVPTSNSALAASAELSAARVTQGPWAAEPTPFGPTNGPVKGSATLSATVTTQQFDPSATADSGDLWLEGVSSSAPGLSPLSLAPGQSGTITVTVTPTGSRGTTVHAVVYVDTFSSFLLSGDEIAAIPYTYTIR
ncbi:S8 family serine peptidase [Actinocrinis sp.]|uniref:S8 family serine peptidase n=1 Tax=Actinocrinis sp. TaxID=1920516 RepID=UPI002D242C72|nr:S8 family serine peptidase [Actinocrinis sp.]HZP54489.1 S8 family serine peptidase [Actinocrinis sp.]